MTIEDILSHVNKPDANGCWPWNKPTVNGYGRVMGRNAHCVVFEIFEGGIPAGLFLDHRCLNKACVNPDHLAPVTLKENTQRHYRRVAA